MSAPGPTSPSPDSSSTVCRHTTHVDILLFILLVPILHAFTAPPSPGSRFGSTAASFLISLLSPYLAAANAAHIIGQRIRSCRTALQRALRARALCMLVPREWGAGELVDPSITTVHGQLPSPKDGKYDIVLVPDWYQVEPQLQGVTTGEMKLACSPNLVRAMAAIVHIMYGSVLIYQARNPPVGPAGYPYNAYAVAAVPYVFMSFLNLIALLCRPHYAGLYVVGFRGERHYPAKAAATPDSEKGPDVKAGEQPSAWALDAESKSSGTVGYAYSLTQDSYATYDREHRRRELTALTTQYLLLTAVFAAPYLVIHALPALHGTPSTIATVIALATGQVLCLVMALVEGCMLKRCRLAKPPVLFPFTDWHSLKWTRPAEVRVWWDRLLTGQEAVGVLGRAVISAGIIVVASIGVVGWRIAARGMWGAGVCMLAA